VKQNRGNIYVLLFRETPRMELPGVH